MANQKDRQIFVMRHAKSDWSEGLRDFDRPLAPRGIRDAKLISSWLAQTIESSLTLLYSPAKRAAETADFIVTALGPQSAIAEERLYLAELDRLLRIIADYPDDVMLIGHNPGLEDLVRYLVPNIDRAIDRNKLLPTAAIYGIRIGAKISAGVGECLWHQRPKQLRE